MTTVQDLFHPPQPGHKAVLFFWAPWHGPSNKGGDIDKVYNALAQTATASTGGGGGDGIIDFYRVEAEAVPDLSLKYGVTVVPTFILLDSWGKIIDRVDGGDDISRLTTAVSSLANLKTASPTSGVSPPPQPAAAAATSTTAAPTSSSTTQTENEQGSTTAPLETRLKSLINSSDVMLFMKGTPTSPRCGFSRQAVDLLVRSNIAFGTFDILTDESVRQGLKTFSDWPTYPQLYVHGELIGGLDIMKEMAEDSDDGADLAAALGVEKATTTTTTSTTTAAVPATTAASTTTTTTLEERLKQLIHRNRIMLFMKGVPSSPKCGFSRQIVELLEKENVPYDTFNILEDEQVRQGLKTYSDWPTYPQLYVDGDLIGGLDIVKEMADSGELTLCPSFVQK